MNARVHDTKRALVHGLAGHACLSLATLLRYVLRAGRTQLVLSLNLLTGKCGRLGVVSQALTPKKSIRIEATSPTVIQVAILPHGSSFSHAANSLAAEDAGSASAASMPAVAAVRSAVRSGLPRPDR